MTAHDTLSGPATRKILEREFSQFGQREYDGWAQISVPQLYRLRQGKSLPQAARALHQDHADAGVDQGTALE